MVRGATDCSSNLFSRPSFKGQQGQLKSGGANPNTLKPSGEGPWLPCRVGSVTMNLGS